MCNQYYTAKKEGRLLPFVVYMEFRTNDYGIGLNLGIVYEISFITCPDALEFAGFV